jgi:hypothetical protein
MENISYISYAERDAIEKDGFVIFDLNDPRLNDYRPEGKVMRGSEYSATREFYLNSLGYQLNENITNITKEFFKVSDKTLNGVFSVFNVLDLINYGVKKFNTPHQIDKESIYPWFINTLIENDCQNIIQAIKGSSKESSIIEFLKEDIAKQEQNRAVKNVELKNIIASTVLSGTKYLFDTSIALANAASNVLSPSSVFNYFSYKAQKDLGSNTTQNLL